MQQSFFVDAAKLYPNAKLPTRKFPKDAGMDFYALEEERIPPHSFKVIKTGITIKITPGCVGLIFPKSRNNHLIGAGVVDEDYQGEILVKIVNYSNEDLLIKSGDAVAQMVIIPIFTPQILEVHKDLIHQEKTERGNSGGIHYSNNN